MARTKTPNDKSKSKGKGRAKGHRDDAIPGIYQDMLAEAEAESSSPSKLSGNGRTVKKPRVGGRLIGSVKSEPESLKNIAVAIESQPQTGPDAKASPTLLQTIDVESQDSTDSDAAWEEVDLQHDSATEAPDEDEDERGKSINLVLDIKVKSAAKKPMRKKPPSAEVRKTRLAVHKLHLLCLLSHVYLRNHWCNDEQVQRTLRKLLSKDTILLLNPSEDKSQFQRDRSFMDGLKQASDLFRSKFHLTARGMSSSQWTEDGRDPADIAIPKDIDLPMNKSDFRELARRRQGSRDVGQQLFCAMLRSAGLDARLVSSLQPLPFTANAAGPTYQRPERSYIIAEEESEPYTNSDEIPADRGINVSFSHITSNSNCRDAFRVRSKLAARLGRPPPTIAAPTPAPPEPKKASPRPIHESPFPIYWVEAFNAAIQKWISVDPLTTKSIAQPSKLCPPLSDSSNRLSYVLAFEEEYAVRDVTLRYAQAFNAKTRRSRVENTKGGKSWWERILRFYKTEYALDRDQVEDAELRAKEAREPMPRNVADFKGHPLFALERHLKRGEVIHPKRKVGIVNIGSLAETVYRRKDVHIVKSADNWYRLGREIKPGEQALKRVQPRHRAHAESDDDASNRSEGAGTPLYALFQTEPYAAPPVVNGRVPKNAFGNIDIYVSSMIPPGGVHIRHPESSRAARVLGIDYSDAVTGFEFKGRHGTAVVKGVVIAQDYQEALLTVLQGFDDERRQEEEEKRALEALKMWKRIVTGLKIRQRIDGYQIEGQRSEHDIGDGDLLDGNDRTKVEESHSNEDENMAGGFMPDIDASHVAKPTAPWYLEARTNDQYPGELGSNDLMDDDVEQSQSMRRRNEVAPNGPVYQLSQDENTRGGFMVDDNGDDDDDRGDIPAGARADLRSEALPKRLGIAAQLTNLRDGFEKRTVESNNGGGSGGHSTSSSTEYPKPSQHSPLLNHDEFEEATMLQQLHESEQTMLNATDTKSLNHSILDHLAIDSEPPRTGLQEIVEDDPSSSDSLNMQPTTSNEQHPPTVSKRKRSSSLESKGSLLSYDPEDTDAEPDWLD